MTTREASCLAHAAGTKFLFVLALAASASGQVTERASLGAGGTQAGFPAGNPALSADGRYVAFASHASNLVPGDGNNHQDVFVRDRASGTTERVSLGSSGAQSNGDCLGPAISADGRYVAFYSDASDLVPGDANETTDVFVRDRALGTTERVSVGSAGTPGDRSSYDPSISGDGRYVAYASLATNLVPGDTNEAYDVFVRDRLLGTTERVSVGPPGARASDDASWPSISADGRYVAFQSDAPDLVPGDTNAAYYVFVHDRVLGTTERASVSSSGAQGSADSQNPWISADGRSLAFRSHAADLVAGDTNLSGDIFVRDLQLGTTERVSVASGGTQASYPCDYPSISGDGRHVVFMSAAADLVPGDTNGVQDDFLHDRLTGTTERISVTSSGTQANATCSSVVISGDGRLVAFESSATNLIPGDTNGWVDVFAHDRLGVPSFTTSCDPGQGGVLACPCSNPPSGPGRGCENSSGTGGAVLSAAGGSLVSSDSLTFATSGQTPSTLSLVTQASAALPAGVAFGQGVRCASGLLLRLYTKTASGGGITAPDFAAGDPSVTARSAGSGDPILPGQSRWYFVYYRDPLVLGGCPASLGFNVTQTGRVDWTP